MAKLGPVACGGPNLRGQHVLAIVAGQKRRGVVGTHIRNNHWRVELRSGQLIVLPREAFSLVTKGGKPLDVASVRQGQAVGRG